MHCPKCNSYTHTSHLGGVEIDFCPACGGVWCDAGELAQLAQTSNDLPPISDFNPTSKTPYRCPRCGGNLEEKDYDRGGLVKIDQCLRCQGIWLDAGEMEKIQDLNSRASAFYTPNLRENLQMRNQKKEALTSLYQTGQPVSKTDTLTRNQFIAKVYRLLTISLMLTAVGAFLGFFLFGSMNLSLGSFCFLLIFWVALLIACYVVRRQEPINLLLLFSFTFVGGLVIAPVLMAYVAEGLGHLIGIAAALTAAIFLGLSYYVHTTKKDFDYMGGFLYTGLFILIFASIFYLFFPSPILDLAIGFGGAFLFSGFILFDTSRIIRKYDVGEYVAATIDLYLDIVNLFLEILRVLGYLSR